MTRSVTVERKPFDKDALRDCEGLGHHNHEPDGSVYVRHEGRTQGEKVTVSCCFCGTTTPDMPVYSRSTSAPALASYSRAACGDALPVTKRTPNDVETRHAPKQVQR